MAKGTRGGKRNARSQPSNKYTDDYIVERLEEDGYELTDNPNEAIYILRDGRLVDGAFYGGQRGEDHRMIESVFDDIDRYSDNFWGQALGRTGMVMLVPETKTAIVYNTPTDKQQKIIKKLRYTYMAANDADL